MKLQKLHDRITIRNKNKPMRSSLPHALGSKAYTSNVAAIMAKPSSDKWNDLTVEKGKEAESDLTILYPPSLRVYIWILEAADSHRLSMQMKWSLKSKIFKLAEIQQAQDAVGIASVLTQRVLSLKALASLLGFLSFSLLIGSSSHGHDWEMCWSDLPINVMETLEKAVVTETVLLNLPWVLDYLHLIRVNNKTFSIPIFQRALQAVHNVYNYAILDPNDENFGVPSMCILAFLDRFFDNTNFPAYSASIDQTVAKPGKLYDWTADVGSTNICHRLDRMKGLIDNTFIQQCCPSLMELRLLLAGSEGGLSSLNNASKPHGETVRSVRKITPLHDPSSFHILDRGSSLGLCDASISAEEFSLIALQRNFFQQRQELQRLVDFVIDTTAVNASRAASLKCVPPILEEAMESLKVVLAQKYQVLSCKEGSFQQELEVEAAAENVILSSIQKALSSAMEYAKGHAMERASRALELLANQDESPHVLGIAANIAADTAGLAACKKTLANISSDIRKYVTQEIESWRQRCKMVMKLEEKLQEQAAVVSVDMGTEIQRLSSTTKKSTAALEVRQPDPAKMQLRGLEHEGFLVNRLVRSCAQVVNLCADNVQLHDRRYELRVKLAAISNFLETLLSSRSEQIPGGFDLYIYGNLESHQMSDFVTLGSEKVSVDAQFRIERGLIKRAIALALYLCLQLPMESMGYDDEILSKCICGSPSICQLENEIKLLSRSVMCCSKLSEHEKTGIEEEKTSETEEETRTKRVSDCQMENYLGNFMTSLVGMWRMLIECGICDASFLISEFLSLRRWSLSLHSEPWKASKWWFQAVKHGIAAVLIEILRMDGTDKSAYYVFKRFVLETLQMKRKESRDVIPVNEKCQNLRVTLFAVVDAICVNIGGIE
ncbi:hypothetical protein GOP47_0008898 [Adiantum capillus-veneris]|nr:hypothetical protein GOP47_0008898 [Adiantum capillus-veneris]